MVLVIVGIDTETDEYGRTELDGDLEGDFEAGTETEIERDGTTEWEDAGAELATPELLGRGNTERVRVCWRGTCGTALPTWAAARIEARVIEVVNFILRCCC